MTLTSEYQYIGRSNGVPNNTDWFGYYILLYAKTAENTATGRHTVYVKQRLACPQNASFYDRRTSGKITVEGTDIVSWSGEAYPTTKWNETELTEDGVTYLRWIDLREGSLVINVGYSTEKDIQIDATWQFREETTTSYYPMAYWPADVSATVTLPRIAGTSQPTVSAASAELGTGVTILTNRASGSGFTHTLAYTFGSASGVIAQGVEESVTWYPDIALAGQIPNDESGVAVITCTTYSGSDPVGSRQVTVTLSVPESVVPTAALSWSDASGALDKADSLVQNVSRLAVTVTGTGIYGSTIVSTAVQLQGKGYTGGILTESGQLTLTALVTDSRGRTGKRDYPITVAAYSAPRLTLSASRCLEDGTADDAGGYALITVSGFVSAVGGEATLKVTWGDSAETVTGDAGEVAYSKVVEADPDTTMAISAALSDKLLTAKRSMTLSTGYATLDLLYGGKGIAFGKAATREGFDCAMPAYFTGGVSIVCGTYNGDFRTAPEGTWWTQPANGTCSNYPEGAQYGFITTTISSGLRRVVYVAYHTYEAYECNNVNGWHDWKRVDGIQPPLAVGTSYKTNGFYKGKQVRKKLISFGTLPASGEKQVSTGIAFADYEIVGYSIQLLHSSGEHVYSMTPNMTFGFHKSGDNWYAAAEVTADLSAYTATVVISYTEKG